MDVTEDTDPPLPTRRWKLKPDGGDAELPLLARLWLLARLDMLEVTTCSGCSRRCDDEEPIAAVPSGRNARGSRENALPSRPGLVASDCVLWGASARCGDALVGCGYERVFENGLLRGGGSPTDSGDEEGRWNSCGDVGDPAGRSRSGRPTPGEDGEGILTFCGPFVGVLARPSRREASAALRSSFGLLRSEGEEELRRHRLSVLAIDASLATLLLLLLLLLPPLCFLPDCFVLSV